MSIQAIAAHVRTGAEGLQGDLTPERVAAADVGR